MRRPWTKSTRVTYRDGWPRWCISSLVVPADTGEIAVRLLACKRPRGHSGKHRAAGQWWSDEQAQAAADLYAAHNRAMHGALRYLGRPPRRPRRTTG